MSLFALWNTLFRPINSLRFEVALFAAFADWASHSTAPRLDLQFIAGSLVFLDYARRGRRFFARRLLKLGGRIAASGSCLIVSRLRLRNALSFLFFLLANERSNHANFVIVMLVKVETELLCRPQLH